MVIQKIGQITMAGEENIQQGAPAVTVPGSLTREFGLIMIRFVPRNVTMAAVWRVDWKDLRLQAGRPVRRQLQESRVDIVRA